MKHNFSIKDGHVFYKGSEGKIELTGISANGFEAIYKKKSGSLLERWYLKDERGIWWFSEGKAEPIVKFVSEDIKGFKIINDEYAKDCCTVYFSKRSHIAIPNSDASTFQTLGYIEYFAKDKNQVYAYSSGYGEGLMIFNDADPDTFVNTGFNGFAADRDNLYRYYHELKYSNDSKKIEVLDIEQDHKSHAATPNEIFDLNKQFLYKKFPDIKGWWHPEYDCASPPPEHNCEGYVIDDLVYYYENTSNHHVPVFTPTIIRSADKESFTQLDNCYGKDKNRVYYKWHDVEGADTQSFEAIAQRLGRDKTQYFYDGHVVEGADYRSFEIIEELCDQYRFAARDSNFLYFDTFKRLGKFKGYGYFLAPVKNSDPDSFVILNEAWYRDKNNVYRYSKVFKKADPNTFEYLLTTDSNNHWAKDKTNLYNANGIRTVNGIDGGTFEVLNRYWGKDKDNVFCFVTEKILPYIDVHSFNVTDDAGGAEDEFKLFWFDESKGYLDLKKRNKFKK